MTASSAIRPPTHLSLWELEFIVKLQRRKHKFIQSLNQVYCTFLTNSKIPTLVYHDSQNATEITQFPQIAKNIKSIVFKIFETLNRNVAELR